MPYITLISCPELHEILHFDKVRIFDCRTSVGEPDGGRVAYTENHVPHAHYIHLNDDLSDLSIAGQGRHPLPDGARFIDLVQKYGIEPDTQVIVYDNWHGGIAARMWWMLRNIGHENVAVLDGGWKAWVDLGLETSNQVEHLPKRNEVGRYTTEFNQIISHTEMEAATKSSKCIIDSRAAERYRGEHEPIDPIAGHIPSAINLPFLDNLNDHGKWKSKEELKSRFESAVGDHDQEDIIVYCGSGVTACHNILAMHHAGLEVPTLYVPSWSGWISDSSRELVTL